MSIHRTIPFLVLALMVALQGCGVTTCYAGPEPAASQLVATIVHADTLAAVSGKATQRKIVLTTSWIIAPEEFSRTPYLIQVRSSPLLQVTLTTASGSRSDTLTTDLSPVQVQTFAALGGTSFLETSSVIAKETP